MAETDATPQPVRFNCTRCNGPTYKSGTGSICPECGWIGPVQESDNEASK